MRTPRVMFASYVLIRGFTGVSSFLLRRPTLFPPGPPPAHSFSRSARLSKVRSTTRSQEKKGPKLVRKRNKNLFRADRVLANRGCGSRSECANLLKQRRVSVQEDNGERTIVKSRSERLTMDAPLFIDSTPVPTVPLLLAYHKPKWVLSVLNDPHGRPHLGTLLSDVQKRQKLHPVGRLDYDTSGLLLFSTNGSLTQRLLHPTHHIEKEYVALVDGNVDHFSLKEKLAQGVETAEGVHTAELLQVTHVESEQVPELLTEMRSKLPDEYNVTDLEVRGYLFNETTALSKVRLKVSEGKHRMVRRMLANCGHGVVELKRERHGQVTLGDLKEGEFRELTDDEQDWAECLASKQKTKMENKS